MTITLQHSKATYRTSKASFSIFKGYYVLISITKNSSKAKLFQVSNYFDDQFPSVSSFFNEKIAKKVSHFLLAISKTDKTNVGLCSFSNFFYYNKTAKGRK